MVGKHSDLPTSKLVLVSQRGFTKDAREAALASNAVPFAPEDLSGDDPERDVVEAVPALWPKVVTFSAESGSRRGLVVEITDLVVVAREVGGDDEGVEVVHASHGT